MENIYSQSMVAYIDILGFKNIVKDPSKARLLLQVLQLTKKMRPGLKNSIRKMKETIDSL